MPAIESLYAEASGYHATQLEVPPEIFGWIARERARKIQPLIDDAWRVLEFGAGTGLNLAALVATHRAAFDIAGHLGPRLAELGITFHATLAEAGEANFDCVLSHHSLEHTPDPSASLAAMRRALKPGGRLALFVPFEHERRYRRFDRSEPNHHLFSWNVQTIANLVETQGYRVEHAALGAYGYERFAAIAAWRLGLGEPFYLAALRLLRLARPVYEIRVIARAV